MESKYAKLTLPDGSDYYLVPPEDVEKISESDELRMHNAYLVNQVTDLMSEKELAEKTIVKIAGCIADWNNAPDTEDPEEGDNLLVYPGDDIQYKIDMAEPHDVISLLPGVHRGTFNLSGKKDITIRGENGAIVDNMVPVGDIEEYTDPGISDEKHFSFKLPDGLWDWRGDHPGDEFNNELMFPLLVTLNDKPLTYNPNGHHRLDYGEFYHDAWHHFYVRAEAEEWNEWDLRVCPYPRIVWGDEETENITLEGIKFKGCSNTGKTGAISTPGKGWRLINVEIDLVNTIGIELGQGGEKADMRGQLVNGYFKGVMVARAGQQGWWGSAKDSEFEDCGHYGSNWRGFDHWWEASHKLENTHNCTFTRWVAKDCNGPGFWLDGVRGGNSGNKLIHPLIENCARSGIDLELDTVDTLVSNPMIKGIRVTKPNPAKDWDVAAGITIKAKANNNTIEGGYVHDALCAVRLENEDGRGVSTGNRVTGLDWNGEIDKKYRVIGEVLDNTLL